MSNELLRYLHDFSVETLAQFNTTMADKDFPISVNMNQS